MNVERGSPKLRMDRKNPLLSIAFIALAILSLALDASAAQDPTHVTRPRRVEAPSAQTSSKQAGRSQQPAGPEQNPPQRPTQQGEPVGEDEVVRIETDLTNVLFSVRDKNRRFVTTLQRDDIRVYEDDIPQEIFTFERQTERPLSLAILIDTSLSQELTLPVEKMAARAFVRSVMRPDKDEVAVISFTGDATLEQGLTSNVERIQRAIDRVSLSVPAGYVGGGMTVPGTPPISGHTTEGTTAIWDAIWVTCDEVLAQTSDRTRRAIILLSDGQDTSSRYKIQQAIDQAIKTETSIYVIGIGDLYNFGIDEKALRKLAENTGGRAFFPHDERELHAAFAQIQEELRSQYLVAYSPTNKRRDGSYRRVRIEIVNPELRKQKLQLSYRQGYFAKSDAPQSKKNGATP
jgi:Ca-activated chloride channel family protein